jgi:glycosyltransferase involved in cell wall biosynthesis
MNVITVSVFILTYNQEQYIAQTLESIINQKTNFSFQLVIGEDCSTDGTRAICESYVQKFPSQVKLLPAQNENIGLISNYMRTFAACDGKYVAICDGDDYWVDDLKLQKQVDFLEQNKGYDMVYTAYQRLYPNGDLKKYSYHLDKAILGFEDLIMDNFIASVTVLFRNRQTQDEQLPSWIHNYPFGDWPTYLWTIKEGGKIHYMNDVTAVYRMDIGVSAHYIKKNSTYLKLLLRLLYDVRIDSQFTSQKTNIENSIVNKKLNLMTSLNREQSYGEGFLFFSKMLPNYPTKWQLLKLYGYSIYKSFTN